jgi:hypothetical protein
LISKNCSATSSPRSVRTSSERCSVETSPWRSAVTQSNLPRGDIYSSCVQKLDGNDSGKCTINLMRI